MTVLVQQPTRVRYGVLAFASVLSMVTYLDRVCMGTVAPYMQSEFGLSDYQLGWVLGAFTLAYASFEVPSGWLGDVFGPRRTLIRIVLWWSLFTALTGLIWPTDTYVGVGVVSINLAFLALLVVRFLFGLGEAGAYPNIARAFHNWFPFQERGSAKGTVWMAGRLAGGLTPFVVYLLLAEASTGGGQVAWRHTFWIFGVIGVVWCIAFSLWFCDRPEEKAGVNAAEVALIHQGDPSSHERAGRIPWGKLLTSGNLWALCAMYACAAYGWYFNITFLPKYLKDQYGLEPGAVKFTPQWWSFTIMAGSPLLLGALACLLGGLMTDAFIRRTGNRKWGRRLFGVLGHGLCAACYFLAIAVHMGWVPFGIHSAWLFVLPIALAAFWNDITMGASWASCLDIGGKYSGIVAGCMNTVGNLGGFFANIITGYVLGLYTTGIDKISQPEQYYEAIQPAWKYNFLIFGSVYLAAVVLWLFFDSTKPVAPSAVAQGPAEGEEALEAPMP
jgi:MFS family permease